MVTAKAFAFLILIAALVPALSQEPRDNSRALGTVEVTVPKEGFHDVTTSRSKSR
jgi:hypothetical protein